MAQTTMTKEVAVVGDEASTIPALHGRQPIQNLAAFMETLPNFEPEESEAFERAIAENRASRRSAAADNPC